MPSLYVVILAVMSLLTSVFAVDNGLGLLPQMGYNTWNDFNCNINAQNLKDAADAIIRFGLDKVGYKYVNLDDCWAVSRQSDGTIVADPKGFPDGMAAVADYVHTLGLKFGIYTDRGTMTCQRRPGSQGFEVIDAKTYASWGVDYLKEDSCYASDDHPTAFKQYGAMRDALNATGRPIFFSLCGWNSWYAPQGESLGNSWRISGDCYNWPSIITAINTNADLAQYAGPGAWNDPDMLIGSSNTTAMHVLPYQSRTMFSMWAVMTAPLLIGSNIINLNSWDLATYSNPAVIAINQDSLGKQGTRVAGGQLVAAFPLGGQSTFNVWAKALSNKATAVCFLNNANSSADVICDANCFKAAGLTQNSYTVFDAWTKARLGKATPTSGWTALGLTSTGGSQLLVFVPVGVEFSF
jgi:alpha-galactosidase